MRSNASASTTASLPFEEQDSAAANWKQEVADRVAERRARQQQTAHVVDVRDPAQAQAAPDTERAARAARIAASVAARYAEAPLFGAAFPVVQNATPAHESARAHQAIAEKLADSAHAATATVERAALNMIEREAAPHRPTANFDALFSHNDFKRNDPPQLSVTEEAVDVVIAAPVVEDVFAASMVIPQQPLPANLIPFPREIVAARRARPRLTERSKTVADSTEEHAAQIQLRIFEVDAPPAVEGYAASSSEITAQSLPDAIYLDTQAPTQGDEPYPAPTLEEPLPVAAISSRAMAFAVDFSLVTGALFAFLLVFALTSPQLPAGKLAGMICAVVYGALWLLYQGMFFSLGYATAGMRYARIAFCTMDDSNPTRSMLLRRIPAWWISALPLGLGFLWAAFDEEGLCWHDRISGLFLRSY
jgi:uncharacterized RDD family membrane protein YckC